MTAGKSAEPAPGGGGRGARRGERERASGRAPGRGPGARGSSGAAGVVAAAAARLGALFSANHVCQRQRLSGALGRAGSRKVSPIFQVAAGLRDGGRWEAGGRAGGGCCTLGSGAACLAASPRPRRAAWERAHCWEPAEVGGSGKGCRGTPQREGALGDCGACRARELAVRGGRGPVSEPGARPDRGARRGGCTLPTGRGQGARGFCSPEGSFCPPAA